MGIITSLVLVKYRAFDSTVLLKSQTYEMALLLRDAQFKSVAAMRNEANSFNYPFGATFEEGAVTYNLFTFETTNDTIIPHKELTDDYKVVQTFTMGRSLEITDICIVQSGVEICDIDRIDISYRRPEFRSLFYAVGQGGPYNAEVTSARIVVTAGSGSLASFDVKVSALGQISVGHSVYAQTTD